MTHNEPIFSVSTSPNSTEITKLILNNNTSICLCIVFAMTSRPNVRKKRNNFKINRKGGIFLKKPQKSGRSSALSEDLAGMRLCRLNRCWVVIYNVLPSAQKQHVTVDE